MTDKGISIPVTDEDVRAWVKSFDTFAASTMFSLSIERLVRLGWTHEQLQDVLSDEVDIYLPS